MIYYLDINTIWRRQFGSALANSLNEVSLVSISTLGQKRSPTGTANALKISLPIGWANKTSRLAMWILQKRLRAHAKRQSSAVKALVLTSFHYGKLCEHFPGARIIYYCSDDYRSYAGWEGLGNVERERNLCRRADLSIFVSEGLRVRAIQEYGLKSSRTIVLPNATEGRFKAVDFVQEETIRSLKEPRLGVVGVLNARIDYDFLWQVAEHSSVGALALIGPIEAGAKLPSLERLLTHPKVSHFGVLPHEVLHQWTAALDVGVIPYAKSSLNHFCSPMRLYDHLAVGHPILATPFCEQVLKQANIFIAEGATLGEQISAAVAKAGEPRMQRFEGWEQRATVAASRICDLL